MSDVQASETFVLDLDSNPHPELLKLALDARSKVNGTGVAGSERFAAGYWLGMLDAMAAATGCSVTELIAWMDRHETRAA